MLDKLTLDFNHLILTNPVYCDSHQFHFLWCLASAGKDFQPIVVVRGDRALESKYFILDGNHRAVIAALRENPVTIYEVRSYGDVDDILAFERHGTLPSFPHRRFLTGAIDFSQLQFDAIQAAFHKMDYASAANRAKSITAEDAVAQRNIWSTNIWAQSRR